MIEKTFSRALVILAVLLAPPLQAMAMPAITCHCFRDRNYDPAQPTLADPYFLATTQNSFFAQLFAVDKGTVVMKKQGGASSDDMWIAWWVAPSAGVGAETLLQKKQGKDNWKELISPYGLNASNLGGRVAAALQARSGSARLAGAVVDEIVLRRQLIGEGELAELRRGGATNQEVIIAILIAGKLRLPAQKLFLEVRSGKSSWGALLQRGRIDGHSIEQEVAALLKQRRR